LFWAHPNPFESKEHSVTVHTDHVTDIIKKFKRHESDTGSAEVQVALLSDRIATLTEHFKVHTKDFAGRRGLLMLVSRRRSLLDYMRRCDEERYKTIISTLGLRK
jgi:small subunit ribosomal protein S15